MAQKYIMWGDKTGIPFMTLNKREFKCILGNMPSNFSLRNVCYKNNNLTSVSFPKLTTISGNNALSYAFYRCGNLT